MAKKPTNDDDGTDNQRAKIAPILQDKILQAFSVVAKRKKNVDGLKAATKEAKESLEAARGVLEAAIAEAAGDLDAPLFDHAEQFVDAAAQEALDVDEDGDPDEEADETEKAA